MRYHPKKPFHLSESKITPEKEYNSLSRRKLIQGGATLVASSFLLGKSVFADSVSYAWKKNSKYVASDALVPTDSELFYKYNNFYEFSLDKEQVHRKVDQFKIDPWKVEIGGLVEKPMNLDVQELIHQFPIEQRVYRLRCVEKWAAVVPWDGFPLRSLVEAVVPKSNAKFIQFTSFNRPNQAPSQRSLLSYPWPYTEGLRMDEAMHDLALIGVGAYGSPLKKQNGAPIRLVVPWKYGFKSIKSITKIEFVEKMPSTLWNRLAPREYGFYANVNPNVSHPRWSQKYEKPLGSWFKNNETKIFNGYEEVASLYKGMDLKRFY